jgi:hypothetical protein
MAIRSPSYDDACQPRMIEPWYNNSQYAPTPGNFGCTPATSYSPSPAPDRATSHLQPDQLRSLPFSQWEEGVDYNNQQVEYICYTIEWRLKLNRKMVGKVTEADLFVPPSNYWEEVLKADIDDMLRTKKKHHQ